MADPTNAFPEGVKIFQKDNFRGKSIPKNHRFGVSRMLVIADSSIISLNARVHMSVQRR